MNFPLGSISACPSCGRLLQFASRYTNLLVCPSCVTTLYRNADTTFVKPILIIKDRCDVIQTGTTGKWDGRAFEITGRVRLHFDESAMNYWTLLWEDGEVSMLEEGYGLYTFLKTTVLSTAVKPADIDRCRPGSTANFINNKELLTERKQKMRMAELEGEAFFPQFPDSITIADFAGADDTRITIIESAGNKIYPFETTSVSAAEIAFFNVRQPVYEIKEFECATCNETVQLKHFPYSQSAACHKCGSFYQYNGSSFKKMVTFLKASDPLLPIGSTGMIEDYVFELIGYAEKEDHTIYHSRWKEYVLYNDKAGYAFLSEYEGHWIFIKETRPGPVIFNDNIQEFTYKGMVYNKYNRYTSSVLYAVGEFPYNVFDNRNTMVTEFVCPPEMWSKEESSAEGIYWFKGYHMPGAAIRKAFGVTDLPYKKGVGAVQPGLMDFGTFAKAVIVGLMLLVFTWFITTFNKKERELFYINQSFDSSNTATIVTDKFYLEKASSNVRLKIHADVFNTWFELNATLTNAVTGKEYSLEQGVEYYQGYTDGESWKEGSTDESIDFTEIPQGTYFIQMQGFRDSNNQPVTGLSNFSVTGIYDVSNTRNLWMSLLLFTIWPVVTFFSMRGRESARWDNSPFKPVAFENKWEDLTE